MKTGALVILSRNLFVYSDNTTKFINSDIWKMQRFWPWSLVAPIATTDIWWLTLFSPCVDCIHVSLKSDIPAAWDTNRKGLSAWPPVFDCLICDGPHGDSSKYNSTYCGIFAQSRNCGIRRNSHC
jgi:hypothetical protein